MLDRIEEIRAEAAAAIEAAGGTAELEELRVRHLGRKAELTSILRGIADLPQEERGPVGSGANRARQELEALLEARAAELDAAELETQPRRGPHRRDPARGAAGAGRPPAPDHPHHPPDRGRDGRPRLPGDGGPRGRARLLQLHRLNHPPGHPARMLQDTFYVQSDPEVLLRTHTSPVQTRAMEAEPPPIFVIMPGKVYRRDSDATHSPMFHQVEGLAIGEGITLADLQGTLEEMLRAIFGARREARMRPHYFPFTEPSVEFDVSCFACDGTGTLAGGERCGLCKGIGWIEVGGAGMVDPNVLEFVADNGYDPEQVQGFAFGMGVERIAMLRHGVPDLRRFFDNDVRMLEQFL